MQIFQTPKFDFLKWRWHAIALSWLIILSGLAIIKTKGVPLEEMEKRLGIAPV